MNDLTLLKRTKSEIRVLTQGATAAVTQAMLPFGTFYAGNATASVENFNQIVEYIKAQGASMAQQLIADRFNISTLIVCVAQHVAGYPPTHRTPPGRKPSTSRDAAIVKLRDDAQFTFNHIAELFGMTRQRIEQIYTTQRQAITNYTVTAPMRLTRVFLVRARSAKAARLLVATGAADMEYSDTSPILDGKLFVQPGAVAAGKVPESGKKQKK